MNTLLYLTLLIGITAEVKICFSPEADCAKVIAKEIQSSKSILIQAYNFTDPEISQAVIEVHRLSRSHPTNGRGNLMGADVYLIIDRIGAVQKGSQAKILQDNGIQVRVDKKHRIAHNKVIILDAPFKAGNPPLSKTARVITGSYNFTDNAQHNNAENLLIISNESEVIKAYRNNWMIHWNHSVPFEAPSPKKQAQIDRALQKPIKGLQPLLKEPEPVLFQNKNPGLTITKKH